MDQGKRRRGGPEARWQERTVLGAVALLMLLGRLELFTVLVLLLPRFWRS